MSIENLIKKIEICCIKKCGESDKCCKYEFELLDKDKQGLLPNKLNILYAPNGKGKSTLAQAFKLIQQSKTKIKLENKHKFLLHKMQKECENKVNIKVKAILNDKDINIISDMNKNDIKNNFMIFVINNNLNVKGIRYQYRGAGAEMIIEDIVIIENIPKKITFDKIYNKDLLKKYNLQCSKKMLETFIVKNLNLVENDFLIKFNNYKKNQLNSLKEKYNTESKEFFCAFLLYHDNKNIFDKYLQYLKYQDFKKKVNKTLIQLKNFDFELMFKEGKVKFPKNANLISNGQRDVLVFISNLLKVEWEFLYNKLHNKPGILIIDEVFDYLDDANFLIAQYYLIELIRKIKKNRKILFTLLLTHLSPIYFKHFYFQRKKIKKEFFLMPQPSINLFIKEIIAKRNESKKDINKYNGLSKLLHFNNNNVYKFDGYEYSEVLKKINDEFGKYTDKNNIETYCPISVCLYLRIEIEKMMYELLKEKNPESISDFLQKKTTIQKLELVSDLEIEVPESWYLLSAIYNDYLHNESNEFLLYKLNNLIIKNLIVENFKKKDEK